MNDSPIKCLRPEWAENLSSPRNELLLTIHRVESSRGKNAQKQTEILIKVRWNCANERNWIDSNLYAGYLTKLIKQPSAFLIIYGLIYYCAHVILFLYLRTFVKRIYKLNNLTVSSRLNLLSTIKTVHSHVTSHF